MSIDANSPAGPPGPLDSLFADKNKVLLILGFLCPCTSGIVFLLSIICILTAKTPDAKKNSKLILFIWLILAAVGFVLSFVFGLTGIILGNN